jgi:hypothetical protein
VSNHFSDWLDKKKIKSDVMVGIHAVNPTWAFSAHVGPGSDEDAHTVVKIGDKVIDFTARQFDKSADFPKISTMTEFRREWKEVDYDSSYNV